MMKSKIIFTFMRIHNGHFLIALLQYMEHFQNGYQHTHATLPMKNTNDWRCPDLVPQEFSSGR